MFLSPLYSILDVDLARAAGHDPEHLCAAWIDAGIQLIQLRAKTLPSGEFLALASRMAAAAAAAGVTFIVNDRVDIAKLSGASGVHVGQGDLAVTAARGIVGDARIVGVSTHNLEQAAEALLAPADYIAIGPIFETTSKANPDPVVRLDGLARVAERARAVQRPLVAIGGITLDRAAEVFAAGASSIAMIAALLDGDPGARARDVLHAVSSARHASSTS